MKVTTLLLSAVASMLFVTPVLADPEGYPEGRGWQALEQDLADIDAAISGLEFDVSGLSDQLDTLQDSVDDVQSSLDARVQVSAETSPGFAVEDGDNYAQALVRVEQMAMGVGGLAAEDFSMITQQIGPAGCTAMEILQATPLGPPGSYALRLVPAVAGNLWCAGTYIATLTVDTGAGAGGALVKVVVPAAP